jgi:hypothetical protein
MAIIPHQPSTVLARLLAFGVLSLGLESCSDGERAASYVLLAPLYVVAAVAKVEIDAENQRSFEEEAQRKQPHPERIPASITDRVDVMGELHADTIDHLLDMTGLAPYRNELFIFRYGTLKQQLWIYYRPNAVLTATFNPFSLQIEGPVKIYKVVPKS